MNGSDEPMALPWKKSPNDKIFINYRRDDAAGFAGRLADSLGNYFGRDRVFRDVTDIDYGTDFERVIDQRLAESGAVVVLIGERWSSVTNEHGQRRLDDPADYVSREIAAALQREVPVVPVLIGGASMPRKEELPEKLVELTRRNALKISDERWDFDVNRLAKVLAIDVPGSAAQRKLDFLKSIALLLLFASSTFATLAFCAAVTRWEGSETALRAAGFTPLISALPFVAILLAGTIALVAAPLMEEAKRKFAWAATAVAYSGALATFIYYALENVDAPSKSLVVNFGAGTLITFAVLALMTLAAFKAE